MSRRKIHLQLLLVLMMTSFSFFAQAQSEYKQLLTHENMQRLEKQNPSVYENRMQIEDLVNQLITSGSLQQVEGTIPVVVHILYKTEEQRISPEQVYSQIEALNQDFNERNTKFEHQALQAEGFADLIETVSLCLQ